MIVCLFCIQSPATVLAPASGLPFVELVRQTVGPKGTIALFCIFKFNGLGQGVSITMTASRLIWGFARDGGLPFSNYLMHVDTYWEVPARALWFQGAIISLVGVLYLFTEATVTAVVSVCTIALTISYSLLIFAVIIFGMSDIPPRTFSLGRLRPVINWVGLIYCCVTTVFFLFPGSPSLTFTTMNLGRCCWLQLAFGSPKGRAPTCGLMVPG